MKTIYTLLIALFLTLSFSSCKKENERCLTVYVVDDMNLGITWIQAADDDTGYETIFRISTLMVERENIVEGMQFCGDDYHLLGQLQNNTK